MKRNIVSAVLCGAVLLTLGAAVAFAAGGDAITEVTVTPNPGGVLSTVAGSGTYSLGTNNGNMNILKNVNFLAKNTTSGQVSYNGAQAAGGNWNGSLAVVAGKYKCWAELNSMNGNNTYTTDSNSMTVTVK